MAVVFFRKDGKNFAAILLDDSGDGESWVIFFPKACVRNCENGRVFSSLS